VFETDKDVLDWYERQPPAVTNEFVDSIPWRDVSNYELKPAFIPVLIYMRDIEYFTDMYYRELLRSPTGKDPIIKKFMERWRVEEDGHANLLNRFLNEAGVPTGENWRAEADAKIPRGYAFNTFLMYWAVKPFGKSFHGAHMTWGAINEITTMHAYRRFSDLAGHPVLKQALSGIIREETTHASFYWNLARVKLNQTKFSRDLARFIIQRFWCPVGTGPKPANEANYVLWTLFNGSRGLDAWERCVARRVERLPGFKGFKTLTERVAPIVQA
jgi:rubrerythrin